MPSIATGDVKCLARFMLLIWAYINETVDTVDSFNYSIYKNTNTLIPAVLYCSVENSEDLYEYEQKCKNLHYVKKHQLFSFVHIK